MRYCVRDSKEYKLTTLGKYLSVEPGHSTANQIASERIGALQESVHFLKLAYFMDRFYKLDAASVRFADGVF